VEDYLELKMKMVINGRVKYVNVCLKERVMNDEETNEFLK
jgi:hypothetical protein